MEKAAVILPLSKKEVKVLELMIELFTKHAYDYVEVSEKDIVSHTETIAYIRKMIEDQLSGKDI